MITTRTRILSILAVVAMLVSMLACFIIPASAAEASFYRSGWQQVIYDIKEYANYSDNTAPQALIDAVDAWLDIGKNGTEEQWLDFGKAHTEALKAALAGDELHWINFGTEKDNMGKGNSNYPMYQYHEFYEAVGYDGLNWSISSKEDWIEMVDVSNVIDDKGTADDVADDTSETFEGMTFHLTKNIDFGGTEMGSLNFGPVGGRDNNSGNTTTVFQGTIDGHGFAFKDINVKQYVNFAKATNAGLFGKVGPKAIIRDFGVDSGTIRIIATGDSKKQAVYAGTFGDVLGSVVSNRLIRVWSGATIIAEDGKTNTVAGIAAASHDSQNLTNGAYFFGTLQGEAGAYGLYHQIKNEQIYNSLSDPKAAAGTTITAANKTYDGGLLYIYSNVYSVGDAALYEGYTGATEDRVDNSGNVESAAEGAWKINRSQPSTKRVNKVSSKVYEILDTPENPIPAVYYTWTKDSDGNDAIRPTGTVDNMIVKVSVSGSVETDLYLNKGTLTKTELAAKLDLPETAITSLTVNGAEAGDEIAISGDTAINVTAEGAELLAVALEKYAALDTKYLTDNAATALIAFREAAAAAGEDLGKIQAVLDSEDTMAAALETYSAYPMAEGKEIPGYALVETYEVYNTAKVWAIGTTADWLKMVDDSKITKKSQSFTGYQFHVLNDIDFDATPDDDTSNVGIPMAPLCFGEGNNDAVTAAFQGKIDGHNHAFKNINVSAEGSSGTSMIGLIGKLSKLATIENFGVDSGTIKATGPAKAYVATFGEVLHTESGLTGTATLNNIWSGADIIAETEGSNVAVGLLGYTDGPVNVNGFYFFGTLSASKSYDVFYRLRRSPSFYNVLSAPAVIGETPHAGMYGVHSTPEGFTVVNNFSTLSDAPDAGTAGTVTNSGKVASALEGAWKINSNPTENPVYFTITEDGIRPIGTADNMIVKVTLSGTKSGELYVNKNSTATVAAIAAALGVSADKVLTINGAAAADVAITGDTTLTVELYVCDHTANTNTEYVWDGANGHKILCSECGEAAAEGTCGGTWAAGEVDLTNGTSKHTKTCPDCKHDYEVACNGTLVADTTDCTNDSKYVFECGVHNAEYVIAGSGHADHDFSEAEWTPAEGAAGTKQSKTCAHCSAKIYQIIGGAEAAGVELKADAEGNIVLTLPIALKSAKLTFTVPAGYTVTNVEGAAADAGFYTVANTAAGATVTITVDSALSAIGGVLEVAVTDAIAEDDTAVTDAIAQATIGFTAKDGDANGDDAVNLADALDVLYVVTSTKNVSTINAYNANVFLANDEDKDALILNVNDVYAIVEAWLLDVAF